MSSAVVHVIRNLDKNTITRDICITGLVGIIISILNLVSSEVSFSPSLADRFCLGAGIMMKKLNSNEETFSLDSGGSRGGSLGSKEPPFCSLNNRKMGVVWLKVGVFHGKLMKRIPLVRVLDPPLLD